MHTLLRRIGLLGVALIAPLLFAPTGFAMQACHDPAEAPLAAIQDAKGGCATMSAAEMRLCAQRHTGADAIPGVGGMNIPPIALAGELALPRAPLDLDPAAIACTAAAAPPRLSKSLLFCTWLN